MGVIKKIIIGVLITVFFAIAITMSILLLNTNKEFGVTQFENSSLLIIDGEISSPKYEKGDLVITEKKPLDSINVGDEVFIFKINDNDKISIELGFVGEVFVDEDAISLENGATYSSKFIAGTATDVYSGLGTIVSLLQSTWIFFFLIVVPCFLIFIYQIYSLIVEIKFGGDEPYTKSERKEKSEKKESRPKKSKTTTTRSSRY